MIPSPSDVRLGKFSRIVCAPDSFKETLTAVRAAGAMAAGVAAADATLACEACPVADGGEGTLPVLVAAMGGSVHTAVVTGPLGEPVEARFGIAGDGRTAIVELAEASGLALMPHNRRDPTATTTFGTGQLIRLAADRGCATVIVCIGGSATVDAGAGLIQALGGRFFDSQGRLITEPLTGGRLTSIARIEPPPDLPVLRVACDVINPLCGPQGAAAVYGPQKGATPEQVRRLDAALAHLAALTGADPDFSSAGGAGAAGGAGFGLVALGGAVLERGIDLVLDVIGFEQRCRGAALVLTGEGRLDAQSLSGKACMGVATMAARAGVPTIAIVGSTGAGFEACLGPGRISSCYSLADRFGMERAKKEAARLLKELTAEVVRTLVRV